MVFHVLQHYAHAYCSSYSNLYIGLEYCSSYSNLYIGLEIFVLTFTTGIGSNKLDVKDDLFKDD